MMEEKTIKQVLLEWLNEQRKCAKGGLSYRYYGKLYEVSKEDVLDYAFDNMQRFIECLPLVVVDRVDIPCDKDFPVLHFSDLWHKCQGRERVVFRDRDGIIHEVCQAERMRFFDNGLLILSEKPSPFPWRLEICVDEHLTDYLNRRYKQCLLKKPNVKIDIMSAK